MRASSCRFLLIRLQKKVVLLLGISQQTDSCCQDNMWKTTFGKRVILDLFSFCCFKSSKTLEKKEGITVIKCPIYNRIKLKLCEIKWMRDCFALHLQGDVTWQPSEGDFQRTSRHYISFGFCLSQNINTFKFPFQFNQIQVWLQTASLNDDEFCKRKILFFNYSLRPQIPNVTVSGL